MNSDGATAPEGITSIILKYRPDTTCYDLAQLTPNRIVVQCLQKKNEDSYVDVLYILDPTDPFKLSEIENSISAIAGSDLVDGKALSYTNDFDKTYLVYGILYEDLEKPESECYFMVYTYDPTPDTDKHKLGNLISNAPITALNFKLDILKLTDFAVLGIYIYALDLQKGVIVFKFVSGNPVVVTTWALPGLEVE
jgi:hypothetical protein